MTRYMDNPAGPRSAPDLFTEAEALADAVIKRAGKHIVLGLPLGLGKANSLANELCARAAADPSLSLTIFTALTLEAPQPKSELAKRFLEPVKERFFAGYPRLAYARMLDEKNLPPNIRVHEFFLQPGNWLGNSRVQQDYVSLNYTHALPFLIDAGVNVIGQLIAPLPEKAAIKKSAPETKNNIPVDASSRYSLSCNPDITADLLELRRAGKFEFLMVGEVNRNLPFMYGAADRAAEDFDCILESKNSFPLFMPPQQPVDFADHAIGLHAASLVPDGGTLQIGIGSIGDAIAHALILRHQHNERFRACLHELNAGRKPAIHLDLFKEGLYGLSEMLVEGFLKMIEAGVIRREVDKHLMHASFFMGSPHFYQTLAALDDVTRRKIAMMPVSYVNELYGEEQEKRNARVNARFINSAILATLTGAIVSDGLESGQVISGVGGQYNFIAQAFALPDARSVITLRATRTRKGKVESNIRWSYGHVTIPRHLRDIVVTEYGVADLRGKSDAQVIAAMLGITDSRFQDDLLQQAKSAGKIASDYKIPEPYTDNMPARITKVLSAVFLTVPSTEPSIKPITEPSIKPITEPSTKPITKISSTSSAAYKQNLLGSFPLGSDFTRAEQQLTLALKTLSEASGSVADLFSLAKKGWRHSPDHDMQACLKRMRLESPNTLRDLLYRYLLIGALRKHLAQAVTD